MSFSLSRKDVKQLFIDELSKANKNNALFHSTHEGFAVLYEEYEEKKFNDGEFCKDYKES